MAKSTMSWFKKIDEEIFKKIDQLQNDPTFSKILEAMNSLSEQEKRITQQILSFVFIFTPFLVVLIMFYSNFQLKKTILTKKDVLIEHDIYFSNRETLSAFGPQFLSPIPLLSSGDFESKLSNIISSQNLDADKVKLKNFEILEENNTFVKSLAILSIERFGSMDFSKLLKNLSSSDKFKIQKIQLNKTPENELLSGEIEFLHLGLNRN